MELINKFRMKVDQWFEKTLGALWALESTKAQLKNRSEPFVVSKPQLKATKGRGDKKEVRGSSGPRKIVMSDQGNGSKYSTR